MLFVTYDLVTGGMRSANLENIFRDSSCFLVGGAPTCRDTALKRLESTRGLLTAGINNAARHFRPNLWFCADHPECYDKRIPADPAILKFAPQMHSETKLLGIPWCKYPGTIFYVQDDSVAVDRILDRTTYLPYFHNTMLASIHILYRLGIKRLYLYGSDFEMTAGKMYKHDAPLNESQKKANERLYNCLADNIRSLHNVFEQYKLEFTDCSEKSKLKDVYRWMDIDDAIDEALEDFPDKTPDSELRHGTVFASEAFRKKLNVTAGPPEITVI